MPDRDPENPRGRSILGSMYPLWNAVYGEKNFNPASSWYEGSDPVGDIKRWAAMQDQGLQSCVFDTHEGGYVQMDASNESSRPFNPHIDAAFPASLAVSQTMADFIRREMIWPVESQESARFDPEVERVLSAVRSMNPAERAELAALLGVNPGPRRSTLLWLPQWESFVAPLYGVQ